jgi:chorismate mutase
MLESDNPIASLSDWWYSRNHPAIIAGPCSAETRDQVLKTAALLAEGKQTHLMRAGIWKPRTRPDSFEGVGEQAIPWLLEARDTYGLPVCVEVATTQHVERCLKAGIDALWIGARTTVNPFSVQEIADVLRGTDIPVLIKNPVNPDLQLWIGAIERIRKAGISRMIAIHRGFSSSGKSLYRNRPMWEIPIALMSEMPEIPIFCDPSHITGKRDLLLSVAQRAMDLGMHGLMIESHIDPDHAWSDAAQQITPHQLNDLLRQLNIRSVSGKEGSDENALIALRSRIDKIDEEIIHLIGQRMMVAGEIGEFKKEHDITILQLERWKEIGITRTQWAKDVGLSADFIEHYLDQIHEESIRRQTEVMNYERDKTSPKSNQQ